MSAQTIRFPRVKKRGPKRRTGPCADVLEFPAMLTGDALRARWSWLVDNCRRWDHEESEGTYSDPKDWELGVKVRKALASVRQREFNDATMRAEIAECCSRIEKRVCIKDWLETLGVDWDAVKSPEAALFFVFDKMQGQQPPPAA